MKYFLVTIFVVILDQISKISIKYYWFKEDLYFSHINVVGNYLRFTFLENPGIAFGINTSKYHYIITLLTIFAIFIFIKYLLKLIKINSYEALPVSLILGGAIGNAIDRIIVFVPFFNYGGVIDFIDVGINNYRWYVFNFADAFITVGLLIYLYKSFTIKENN